MSKCISSWGEFSEHEYTEDNTTCDYCGQVSEMIAVDQLQTMRSALEAIQELHRPWNNSDSADEELVCDHCRQADWYEWEYVPYPCPTRRLADEALNTN